jgi:hypothetical protein
MCGWCGVFVYVWESVALSEKGNGCISQNQCIAVSRGMRGLSMLFRWWMYCTFIMNYTSYLFMYFPIMGEQL